MTEEEELSNHTWLREGHGVSNYYETRVETGLAPSSFVYNLGVRESREGQAPEAPRSPKITMRRRRQVSRAAQDPACSSHYAPNNLRRIAPATRINPAPNNPSVPGSGTGRFESPNRMPPSPSLAH